MQCIATTVINLEFEALHRGRRYVADRAAYLRPVGETDSDGAIPFAANWDGAGELAVYLRERSRLLAKGEVRRSRSHGAHIKRARCPIASRPQKRAKSSTALMKNR